MKKIALGESDFKRIIDNDEYFVDKTLLIKEVFEDSSRIILLPRARRFGKTSNLSMIKYFTQKSKEDNRYLFNNLLIEKEDEIMKKQGRYPTIYLTFKDERYDNIELLEYKLKLFIGGIYNQFKEVYDSINDELEKEFFRKIQLGKGSRVDIELALKKLCEYI